MTVKDDKDGSRTVKEGDGMVLVPCHLYCPDGRLQRHTTSVPRLFWPLSSGLQIRGGQTAASVTIFGLL